VSSAGVSLRPSTPRSRKPHDRGRRAADAAAERAVMLYEQTLPNGETRLVLRNQLPRPTLPDFATWGELYAWIEQRADKAPFWRGQSNIAWLLTSKLQRVLASTTIPPSDWLAVEDAAVAEFQLRARPIVRGIPDGDRLAWLGAMQHYKAPTRLTDWSMDPRVALWFAYNEAPETDGALFMLAPGLCESVYPVPDPTITWDEQPPAERIFRLTERVNKLLLAAGREGIAWPLPLPIIVGNARTDAQRGAFVCDGTLASPLELLLTDDGWATAKTEVDKIQRNGGYFVAGLSNTALVSHREDLLTKIPLRAAWRDEAMAYLGSKGITERRLLPDLSADPDSLDGVGQSIEQFVRAWPSGRR
jgi:hypothetical protein